eukprot:scaffold41178_cov22-Phaeocystis_antarctica.AAC.1
MVPREDVGCLCLCSNLTLCERQGARGGGRGASARGCERAGRGRGSRTSEGTRREAPQPAAVPRPRRA